MLYDDNVERLKKTDKKIVDLVLTLILHIILKH